MANRKKYRYKKRQESKFRILFPVIILILIIILISKAKNNSNATETSATIDSNKINKCIVIDAGHGGEEEPGCLFNDVYEKTINLQIAKKLQELLEDVYADVIMTRTTDVNILLTERAEIANNANADIFVSIHQNSLDDDTVTSGVETWYNPTKDTESKFLAEIIQKNVVEATEAEDLGIKESDGLVVTKNTTMPACLVETGFLSSTKERAKLITNSYQEKIANGIFNGIQEYFSSIDSIE